jgi:hypothetical protein
MFPAALSLSRIRHVKRFRVIKIIRQFSTESDSGKPVA